MRRATKILPPGTFRDPVATVSLTYDDRYRRRTRLIDSAGTFFLLDLDKPRALRHGEGLVLLGGGVITVIAADEPIADIHTHSVAETARIAWHIGNRHTPLQVLPDGNLRIRYDHVLIEMIKGLGAHVHQGMAPFSPLGGAYSEEPKPHSHPHPGHDHDH